MNKFWILILVALFATNSLDKAESVQLEETQFKIFDEIFGEGWWNNAKAEEWHKLTLEHNFLQQIDGQNTQLGQIEPNSTDQNPPLTEANHSYNAKNGGEISSNEKRKIVAKFHAIKDEFKQKRKYSDKERVTIEEKLAKHLRVNRKKIYKWKKEFGLNQKVFTEKERKHLIEKFDQMKAELKRDGIKNSQNELDKTVAKNLGLSFRTIYRWKRKFGKTTANKYAHDNQKELLMKRYYVIKDQNPKISDKEIAKMLKIGRVTLSRWKKQFKRQQFHPNSVNGHSVEVNAAANVQEIENSNLESI